MSMETKSETSSSGDLSAPTGITADEQNAFEYDVNQTREDYIDSQIKKGMSIVYPAPNGLQIDIDSESHMAVFLRSMECFKRNWDGDIKFKTKPSSSGLPRQHITVTLPFVVESWQRIALQAALGSDPLRELLSSIRMMRGDISPTLFVEQPADLPPFDDLL
jgi:hypothetical protein